MGLRESGYRDLGHVLFRNTAGAFRACFGSRDVRHFGVLGSKAVARDVLSRKMRANSNLITEIAHCGKSRGRTTNWSGVLLVILGPRVATC